MHSRRYGPGRAHERARVLPTRSRGQSELGITSNVILAQGLSCTRREQIKSDARAAQRGIVVRANAAAMSFDDRPTHRQTHAHAAVFGREEAIEKTRAMLRIDTRPAVLDAAGHRLGV